MTPKVKSAEQDARDLLERMGVEDAQNYTTGDVIELANILAERDRLRARLPQTIALLQAIVDDAAGGELEGDYAGCVALNDELISHAADLLAVLTEPQQHEKKDEHAHTEPIC